jgi:hypothetical protein
MLPTMLFQVLLKVSSEIGVIRPDSLPCHRLAITLGRNGECEEYTRRTPFTQAPPELALDFVATGLEVAAGTSGLDSNFSKFTGRGVRACEMELAAVNDTHVSTVFANDGCALVEDI